MRRVLQYTKDVVVRPRLRKEAYCATSVLVHRNIQCSTAQHSTVQWSTVQTRQVICGKWVPLRRRNVTALGVFSTTRFRKFDFINQNSAVPKPFKRHCKSKSRSLQSWATRRICRFRCPKTKMHVAASAPYQQKKRALRIYTRVQRPSTRSDANGVDMERDFDL